MGAVRQNHTCQIVVFKHLERMTTEIHTGDPVLSTSARRWMRAWLLLLGVLVYGMILIGGATRLTDSGLSITEWRPISGALPPLSHAEWQSLFQQYQQTAEYKLQNAGMSLAEFEYIYWWEWGHRLFGRLIGLISIIGLIAFWRLGWLKQGLGWKYIVLIALGGLQGAIGWWMVASGIGETTRVDVAPYRLMTHFCLALLILVIILWYWLDLGRKVQAAKTNASLVLGVFATLIFVQMASGALVAGLDAGRTYTDWPMMAGEFVPTGYWQSGLGIRNLFENVATAQFNHRILAYVITVATLWIAFQSLADRARNGFGLVLGLVALQVAWGIYTLVHAAPLPLALVHQGLGVLVLLSSVRAVWRSAQSY